MTPLVLFALLAQIGPCRLPARGEAPRPTRVDFVNRDTPVDFYALALSWSPGYCGQRPRSARWQCEENSFGFVVHGLWPQSERARNASGHPRHCRAPELLSAEAVRPYLCVVPGAQLAQDEWNKHGSCAWPDARAYFTQIETLYSRLRLPDLAGGRTTAGRVRSAIVQANAREGLRAEHIAVRVRPRNQFSELLICYDKRFQFRRCDSPGTPDAVEIFVTPKR